MHVLAIDTSTRQVTVALGTEEGVLAATTASPRLGAPPRHTETLAPAIAGLVDATGIELGALTAVGVGVGPGMFTGLRAGVVTATVLARALGVRVAAIPSLDAVAQPLLEPLDRAGDGVVVAVVDARRAEVFFAAYRPDGTRATDDAVGRPADVADILTARLEPVLLCGDGARRVYEHAPEQLALAGPEFDAPSPGALVALTCAAVARNDLHDPAAIKPRYLRKSDAEINVDIRSERNPLPA